MTLSQRLKFKIAFRLGAVVGAHGIAFWMMDWKTFVAVLLITSTHTIINH